MNDLKKLAELAQSDIELTAHLLIGMKLTAEYLLVELMKINDLIFLADMGFINIHPRFNDALIRVDIGGGALHNLIRLDLARTINPRLFNQLMLTMNGGYVNLTYEEIELLKISYIQHEYINPINDRIREISRIK